MIGTDGEFLTWLGLALSLVCGIFLLIRRRKRRFASRQVFLHWCKSDERPPEGNAVSFSDFLEKRDRVDINAIEKEFFVKIQEKLDNHETFSLSIGKTLHGEFGIGRPGRKNMESDIFHLSLSYQGQPFNLKNLNIWRIHIYGNRHNRVHIQNCNIGELTCFSHNDRYGSEIKMTDSQVGLLVLEPKSVRNFDISGGCIFNLDCPPPDGENPFTGSIMLNDVFFPRSTRTYPISGPQPYRNLRSHLSTLHNVAGTNVVHAAEQAIERETDTSWNKILSYLYEMFSDFGSSPIRPIAWLVGLSLFSVLLIYLFDGADLAVETSAYRGWQTLLIDSGVSGRIARSFVLGFQPITNPLGILGTKTLLVPKSVGLSIWLGIQGLASAVFVALFILALRRRFKMG